MNYGAALRKDMFNRMDTVAMIEAELAKDGMALTKVKHQNHRMTWIAVCQNWRALQFVQEVNVSLVREAVHQSPQAASLLPPEFHLTAVHRNIDAFDYIANPTLEACRFVIQEKPDWIAKRTFPPEICLEAVKQRYNDAVAMAYCTIPNNFSYFQCDYFKGMKATEELLRAALPVTNGWSILASPHTPSLVIEAVRINPMVLDHVSQTPDMVTALCKANPNVFPYVKVKTDALSRMVCAVLPHMLPYVKNPPRDLVWECAKKWAIAIKYAEQDEDLCVHAVKHHREAIAYVQRNRMHVWLKAGRTNKHLTDIFPEFTRTSAFYNFFCPILKAKTMKTTKVLEDPVTLEPVEAGMVCAFLPDEKGNQHFAGTLDTLLDLLRNRFQGSTTQHLFIPLRNALVPTSLLRWRVIA